MRYHYFLATFVAMAVMCVCYPPSTDAQPDAQSGLGETLSQFKDQPDYQEYLKFFREVYKTVEENYYQDVSPEAFNKFLYVFNTQIYGQLKQTGKSVDYIRWRSAAYLVDYLKSPDDIFSAFLPPQPAKKYEETVLGKEADTGEGIELGITGEPVPEGFKVTRIEIRSDAYERGLRENDVLLKVGGAKLAGLDQEQVAKMLTLPEGTTVELAYLDHVAGVQKTMEVLGKEFYKQLLFMIPVDVPGVYCIQIQHFNRTTGEDLEHYLKYILSQDGPKDLIVDLRGNPGGPPLAAREISGFFLSPDEEFAYFQRNKRPKAELFVPHFPEALRFPGNIVVLVNEDSGSASELFSGILQFKKRAVIMGTNTAGQVLLKSMFHFDDESMVLLVTARGYRPDGSVFSYDGVVPDERVDSPEVDLVHNAAEYLVAHRPKAQ